MLLVTGWSDKADGIAFLADTRSTKKAVKLMLAAWNTEFTDQHKLVTADEDGREVVCLVPVDVSDNEVIESVAEYGETRWWWRLECDTIKPGKIAQRMPW